MADIWHIIEKYWIRVWTKFKWFQDDNAPVHRAQITKNYKQENNINCTTWSAQSPDLIVCENVWLCIKRALQPIAGNTSTPKMNLLPKFDVCGKVSP